MKKWPFAELKHKIQHEKDLGNVWIYFWDNFSDKPGFNSLGKPATNPFVETSVKQIILQLVPKDNQPQSILLLRLPEAKFIHGPVNAGLYFGGVMYSEELQQGVVSLCTPTSKMTHFARFTGIPRPELVIPPESPTNRLTGNLDEQ